MVDGHHLEVFREPFVEGDVAIRPDSNCVDLIGTSGGRLGALGARSAVGGQEPCGQSWGQVRGWR